MSGELGFIDVDGREVANSYRTLSYVQRLGSVKWMVGGLGCSVMAREVGGAGPFVSPAADPAPWYDAAVPESGEFLGLMARLDFQSVLVQRSIAQRFGAGGGTIGPEIVAAKAIQVEGYLVASTCPGLEYGRAWLATILGADCEGCTLKTVRVRDSCPPDDGSNDTRGEWLIYDAALVDGITRSDIGDCCDWDGQKFTLYGQSPYKFKRPSAAASLGEVANSGGLMVVPPATVDSFVRANEGPPPSASWTGATFTGEFNTLRILANVLDNNDHTAGHYASAHWTAASFGPDVAATVLCATRVNSGMFEIRARVTSPATSSATGNFAQIQFGSGAGLDSVMVGRRSSAGGIVQGSRVSVTGLTLASGDIFALVCRGRLIELWRKPSAGQWVRLCAAYDPATPVAGRVGLAIIEQGATQTLSTFGAGTLTNGEAYPVDVQTVTIPAVKTGLVGAIVVVTASAFNPSYVAASDVRVQVKQYASCQESDDFSSNDLATKWYGSGYQITGGKLKPTGTASTVTLMRSSDGTLANRVAYPGGRVEAQVKLGAAIANGAWSVGWYATLVAALIKQNSTYTNTFAIGNGANGGTWLDSVAFTPVAATTYRIIFEVLPVNDGTGNYDLRAYLVDQANPGVMLTRPLRAITNVIGGSAIGGSYAPMIQSVPADTGEEWDSFLAVDYSDSSGFVEASIPPGVLTIDAGRRISAFVAAGSAARVDGSPRLASPLDAPLGWPDVCAGSGQACLQVFARESAYPGTTVTVATQARQR